MEIMVYVARQGRHKIIRTEFFVANDALFVLLEVVLVVFLLH